MMKNLDKCYFMGFCSCLISVCDWRMWGNSFFCLYSWSSVWIYSLLRLVLSVNTILNLQSAPDTAVWTPLFLFFYDFWIYWRCGWPISHYDSSRRDLTLYETLMDFFAVFPVGFCGTVWVAVVREVRVRAGRKRAVIYADLTFLWPRN